MGARLFAFPGSNTTSLGSDGNNGNDATGSHPKLHQGSILRDSEHLTPAGLRFDSPFPKFSNGTGSGTVRYKIPQGCFGAWHGKCVPCSMLMDTSLPWTFPAKNPLFGSPKVFHRQILLGNAWKTPSGTGWNSGVPRSGT